MAKSKLTDKQALFCQEYLLDLNATQAAIRAGYSKNSAEVIGHENLRKPNIQELIAELKDERSKEIKVDARWVLSHCSEILQADIGDILDEVGKFKPIHDWPKIWRQMLTAVDIKELFEYTGDGQEKIGDLVKAKFVSREKILELTGRHVNVKAFQEKVTEIHIHQELTSRLQQGRQRVIDHEPLKVVKGGKA